MSNSFDVFKQMGIEDLDIRLGLDVLRADRNKAGSKVTIGIGGDVVTGIATGDLVAILLVYNRKQFTSVREKIDAALATCPAPAREGE